MQLTKFFCKNEILYRYNVNSNLIRQQKMTRAIKKKRLQSICFKKNFDLKKNRVFALREK